MPSFKEITDSETPVLIDFYATWCGPCQTMIPLLDEFKKERGDDVRILKIDVDKNQALAGKFGIRGVPHFMCYRNGKLLWRQSGAMSMADLREKIPAK